MHTQPGVGDHRVLIVSAAMGDGHLQVSRELARRLQKRGHHVSVADLNELMPAGVGRALARLYPWLVNRAPRVYDVIFRVFFLARQRAGERATVPVVLALPGLRRLIAGGKPDVIVSTYHLAALAVARLRERGELGCPAVTFITSFSVHGLWVHPAADRTLCVSDDAARAVAKRCGGPVTVCGPVVRPEFAAEQGDAGALRERFGIRPDLPIALVVAGSSGMGRVERCVAAVTRCGWRPIVVCGRNAVLRERLDRHDTAVALGWVDDMAALMGAVDVLVENAGGLSAKEALRCGLPVVTFDPIAGHGRADAQALVRLGLTDLVADAPDLRAALDRLRADTHHRARRIRRGRELFTGDAAAVVHELMCHDGPPSPDSTALTWIQPM